MASEAENGTGTRMKLRMGLRLASEAENGTGTSMKLRMGSEDERTETMASEAEN